MDQDVKLATEVSDMPYIEQAVGHCGPATLAMVMNWNGKNLSADELSLDLYSSKKKGSLQSDMISVARKQGMMAVTIQGLPSLLKEVNEGHPVIVFENLAFTWLPQWHYAVVYGYDLKEKVVLMHSGPEQAKRWKMDVFERSWMLGDYWGLVVLPPGEIARYAGELANLTAAAALEGLGFVAEAERSYKKILEIWPNSLGGLIGMGNVSYTQKKFAVAISYLKKAVEIHPESKAAQQNLRVAQESM